MREGKRRLWLGPALALAAVAAGHALWQAVFADSTVVPGAALAPVFLAVVAATFLGGRESGYLSAAVATLYLLVALVLAFDVSSAIKAALIAASLFGNVVLVGRLRRRADEALEAQRAATEHARRLAAEATRANDVLRASNETLETFVYVITHDLKEPVRAVDDHLAKAQAEPTAAEGRAGLDAARRTNQRLGLLLQRLLEYSRASLTVPNLRTLTLQETLDDPTCRTLYEHMAATRAARIETPRDPPPFQADPTLLGQALGNLILNAIKHNPQPTPRIALLVHAAGDAVDLVLQDDGPGFPPAVLDHFRRLRVDRAATLRGGFGLVIARRAVERMGGAMTLANLQEGAEVRIRLPAAPHVRRVPVEEAPVRVAA